MEFSDEVDAVSYVPQPLLAWPDLDTFPNKLTWRGSGSSVTEYFPEGCLPEVRSQGRRHSTAQLFFCMTLLSQNWLGFSQQQQTPRLEEGGRLIT